MSSASCERMEKGKKTFSSVAGHKKGNIDRTERGVDD